MSRKAGFPAWRYGPDGESRVCQSEDDVPKGWTDHPKAADAKTDQEADIRAEYIQSRQVEAPVPTAAVTSPEARPIRNEETFRQALEADADATRDRIASRVLGGEGEMTNEGGTPNDQINQKPLSEEKKDLAKQEGNMDKLAPDPLDHDANGAKGGSKKGAESTASRGKAKKAGG